MSLHLLAVVPVLIWIYLLSARGGFWRVSRHLKPAPPGTTLPRLDAAWSKTVIAIVPARDEAASIGAAVTSLLQQNFPGSIQVIVVDDNSTDGTADAASAAAAAAGAAANLTIVQGGPLRPGWTGKLWALSQGVEAALARDPDYLLFTDADIRHRRDNVAALLENAETCRRDLISYMVVLSVETFAERALIPAFVFFFLQLYPPRWIASSGSTTAGAAGGCILIRPQILQRIGGLAAVRSQIIDDCALAHAVKSAGGRIWLGLTRNARSLRRYGSFAEIGSMISRTAFNQLRHSYPLLVATIMALILTFVLPVGLLFTHDPLSVGLGLAAWVLMSLCYLPMVRFYGVSPLWSTCLPAIATFYAGATLYSALQYRLGRGGSWKGRVQDSPR